MKLTFKVYRSSWEISGCRLAYMYRQDLKQQKFVIEAEPTETVRRFSIYNPTSIRGWAALRREDAVLADELM